MKAWVLGQPGLYLWLWLLVRGVVVHAQVQRLALGRTALDHLEKPQPRLMAMELIGHREGFAGEHVQGGEQRADAVALVVVRHRLGAPFLHRQAGLGSLQCLNLRFLIAAQNQRVLGRVEVQAHDVVEFLNQARVVGQLEGVHAMGLQAGGTPYAGNGRCAGAQVSGQAARAPVGRAFGRALQGRAPQSRAHHPLPLDGGACRARSPGTRRASSNPSTPA